MDVRNKFTLKMILLVVVVIVLSVLVFFSATVDPFEEDDTVVDDSNPATLFAVEEDNVQESPLDVQDPVTTDPELPEEDPVVATVTLSDNQPPEQQLRQDDVADDPADDIVSYTVSLRASWSERLHPRFYPQGAHLSPMVAWSHRLEDVLFRSGGIASSGMEIMAETGATKVLTREIRDSVRTGASATYNTGSVFNAPGTDTIQMAMGKDAPYITVVSMIAPSPDWFVAARNVALYQDGAWLDQVQVPAALYDAGTDSGVDFTSDDSDTNPKEVIARIRDVPTLPIATFEFVRN